MPLVLSSGDGARTRSILLDQPSRQHARNEKKKWLPTVHRALGNEQVQNVAENMEASLTEAGQEAEERRAADPAFAPVVAATKAAEKVTGLVAPGADVQRRVELHHEPSRPPATKHHPQSTRSWQVGAGRAAPSPGSYAASVSAIAASPGTLSAGPMVARVGRPRNAKAAAS
ncbi:MAG: hypothetical protein JWO24_2318 [Rhodospirillales bacterium]|nr:hypothetical protein [Rhodospirillales bacterium]